MKKAVAQILIVLLLITENFCQETLTLETSEITPENTTLNEQLLEAVQYNTTRENERVETTLEVTTTAAVKTEEIEDTITTPHTITEQQQVSTTSTGTANEEVQTISTIKQEDIAVISEKSTESLIDETTATNEYELNSTTSNTLEDYALKQMNFILDHLLLETQEFVANVLQATVNTVFQRDHLKRYAEGLNRILNPGTDSEYSDEAVEETKVMTHDELYDEIVLKLNFLKSKPSKYLQRHLPQDWLQEYRNKRAELAIWLDKASVEMHQAFNRYVSEEEDRIKYQYFSEAFDDISRATEIHHKLALLADLVKIVKNKKQITFMDLYMQT